MVLDNKSNGSGEGLKESLQDRKELARQLCAMDNRITKGDRYRACLQFGKVSEPLDLKTICRYLSGNEEEMKNLKLANDLLKYFEACAAANDLAEKTKEVLNTNV